ncbi:MAG: hypothetical protein VSS75_030605 [Candidatus Parabeggiatoa sp.]|nr:hypothetical protein [Candidatus Parabeggiatoa sp.]
MDLTLTKITNNDFLKKRRNKIYTHFSDISTTGSYDYLSQVIQLNSIEKDHIDELIKRSNDFDINHYNIAKKIFPLLAHEQAHWIDNTSTLWGFEFLEKVYDTLSISASDQVNEFHKKKSLYDEIQCIRYPKYYSTTGNSTGDRPWKYQYSVGKLFDRSGRLSEYPIFFTRFNDVYDQLISREPFALCALLESSATHQELLTEISLMQMLNNNESMVEEKLLVLCHS